MVKRRTSSADSVSMDLTAALDVIFNVLSFFVMTFNPPEPERNFDLSLPPPQVQASGAVSGQQEIPDKEIEPFEMITIVLNAGPEGILGGVQIEQKQVQGGIRGLANQLKVTAGAIKGASGKSLETATIVASPTLKYRFIIEAVDACYQANIKKINFAEANAGQ
ncbi:MAG: biopolymer transporter ExbD [Planctomycetota bacterium]